MRRPLLHAGRTMAGHLAHHLAHVGAALAAGVAICLAGAPAARAADAPAAGAGQAVAPLPVADFFRGDQMSRPQLSPSGKYLAVHVGGTGANAGRRRLAVVNVEGPRNPRIVAGFNDADIGQVAWASDDRLVFEIDDQQAAWGGRHWPGLFAVDQDGGNFRSLIKRQWQGVSESTNITSRELDYNHVLLRTLGDGTAEVIVQRLDWDEKGELKGRTALRLDTRTGRSWSVSLGVPRDVTQWWFNATGQPVMIASIDADQTEIHWRPKPDAPWELVERAGTFADNVRAIQDVVTGPDGAVYVETGRQDAATTALFRFDPATRKAAADPLVSIDGFDFDGRLIFDQRSKQLIGVRYTSDARSTAWLNDTMKAVQARIDKKLPGLVNLVDPAACGCSRWMLVTSFSDRQPEVFFLYDSEADKLDLVGQAQPQIDPRRMAERDFVRFKARDGLEIPLHVTRPKGKGPWPTVVLVHGGPHVRGGDWRWNHESQFLASRGYLVLEPEFRGSTGYGGRLFRAGWKQWGLKAQDDIADAARWAIGSGDADAKRICIAGGSYGGYATLMGLIKDADLYRCGVAMVAVTDIGLMYDIPYSDLSDIWRQYGMPRLIGDKVKDADQLATTSPLKQAARLKQPLLMAIGSQDRRVPPVHSVRMRDALKAAGNPPEWIDYADEGHGFLKPENIVDLWTRVERFLARQIGPGAR